MLICAAVASTNVCSHMSLIQMHNTEPTLASANTAMLPPEGHLSEQTSEEHAQQKKPYARLQ